MIKKGGKRKCSTPNEHIESETEVVDEDQHDKTSANNATYCAPDTCFTDNHMIDDTRKKGDGNSDSDSDISNDDDSGADGNSNDSDDDDSDISNDDDSGTDGNSNDNDDSDSENTSNGKSGVDVFGNRHNSSSKNKLVDHYIKEIIKVQMKILSLVESPMELDQKALSPSSNGQNTTSQNDTYTIPESTKQKIKEKMALMKGGQKDIYVHRDALSDEDDDDDDDDEDNEDNEDIDPYPKMSRQEKSSQVHETSSESNDDSLPDDDAESDYDDDNGNNLQNKPQPWIKRRVYYKDNCSSLKRRNCGAGFWWKFGLILILKTACDLTFFLTDRNEKATI